MHIKCAALTKSVYRMALVMMLWPGMQGMVQQLQGYMHMTCVAPPQNADKRMLLVMTLCPVVKSTSRGRELKQTSICRNAMSVLANIPFLYLRFQQRFIEGAFGWLQMALQHS